MKLTLDKNHFNCANVGSPVTVTLTVTDASGNSGSATAMVNVEDKQDPVVETNLADITGECTVTVTDKPTASDNCAGRITATTNDPLRYTTQGTYTIHWSYNDGNGNITTQDQKVIIKDVTNPSITAPAAVIVSTQAGKCSADNVVLGKPVSSDNCSAITVSNDAPAVFNKGTTIVTWTAKDAAGNTSTATQSVTVQDNEKPVVTCPAASGTLCNSSNGNYTIAPLQASDNCGTTSTTYIISGATARSGTGNNASGTFNKGTSTITWTVKDESGNFATCQTTVVINSLITVSIPDVKVLSSGVNLNTVYPGYRPAATATLTATVSAVSGTYTYKWSNGATTASIKVSPTVATLYTVMITDAKGCTATATKQIKVRNAACGNKVNVCHGGGTLCIDSKGVPDHLGHGDYLGACNSGNAITKTMASKKAGDTEQKTTLSLMASPNSSTTYFKLAIESSNVKDKVQISIVDEVGRAVESRTVNAGQRFDVGQSYRAGMYFVQAIQGNKRASVKLVKQAW